MSQTSWKEDYPVSRSAEHRSVRRQFLQFLCLSGLVVGFVSFFRNFFLRQKQIFPAKDILALNQIQSGYYLFRYPTENDPAILVKLSDGTLRAYSQRCTHLLCPVHFKPEDDSLFCPCHNGSFNAKDGSVQYGPPPKPLPQYEIQIRDERIWVMGKLKSNS